MKHLKKLILLSLIIIATAYTSFGQRATATLQKTNIYIGDQISLTFEFRGSGDMNVIFPKLADTVANKIEIIQASGISTEISNDKREKIMRQVLTITSFDSGYFAIKPFRFYYTAGKDTAKLFAETMPLILNVQTLNVDMQKGIRDIKPPLDAKFTIREALPYIIALLIIAGVISFAVYYYKKKKKKEPIFRLPQKPKLPPHEIALKELEELRDKKLWQNNKIKEFHSELTEIIRKYIEGRFGIPALEMISDDIIESINRLDIDNRKKEELTEMLRLADLVKFAKENPLPSEHDLSFNNALDFVKGTIIMIN
jgi:hypothetical protein